MVGCDCTSGSKGPIFGGYILLFFHRMNTISFSFSSESDFPLFSWVHLETEDGPVSVGVIIVIVSVGGCEHVVGGWRIVPVLYFSYLLSIPLPLMSKRICILGLVHIVGYVFFGKCWYFLC